VERLIGSGVRRFVNLASGLDTRPYRLKFPRGTVWWDVDFPAEITFKRECLEGSPTDCDVRFRGADLLDRGDRDRLWSEIDVALPTAVLTEGLLIYLSEQEVENMGRELRSRGARHWICDFVAPKALASIQRKWNRHLGPSPMRFAPDG